MAKSCLIVSSYLSFLLISSYLKSASLQNVQEDQSFRSSQHNRTYKGLTLKNGLKVILISEPDTNVAAGSLHIGAGSMNNPPEVQGLAHLLEHVIFNGNKKYTEPEAFYKYVAERGGQVGGSTAGDYTEYTFTILPDAMEGALDHLYHMITTPLISENSVKQEISVVNAEFVKNIPQSAYQYARVQCHTSRDGHPYKLFTTGSEDTLWTKPKEFGIDVRKELEKYHETYYSSNIMTLSILGKHNLTLLEEMVIKIFSNTPNRNATLPAWSEIPYGPSQLGVKIEFGSKSVSPYVSLEFPISMESEDIFMNYYVSLITHGGNTSLFTFLKSKGLVTTIESSVSTKYRGFKLFYIKLYLTSSGADAHEQVAVHVFEFLNFLKINPPKKWFWDEVQVIADIKKRFKSKDSANSHTSDLGQEMLEYSPEEVIKEYINETRIEYNATQIINALDFLTPKNMRFILVVDSLKSTSFQEPHFKINYNMLPIVDHLINQLKNAIPNPDVRFPSANHYLPKTFVIKPPQNDSTVIPKQLEPTKFSKIWFLQDSNYSSPKVVIRAKLFSPFAYLTSLDSGLAYIMRFVMEDKLLPVSAISKVSGTDISISDVVYGLSVRVTGFNDGIDRVLFKVMEAITSMKFTNETFHSALENYRQDTIASLNYQPCTVAKTDILLTETYWTPEMLYDTLDDISLEDLKLFYSRFMSRLQIEWLFYGNIYAREAQQLVNGSEQFFIAQGSRPGSSVEYKWQDRNVQIPQGTRWLYKMKSISHSSTCTLVTFQSTHPNLEELVKIVFLAELMDQPAYVELRTKQQLGYNLGVYSSREVGYSSNTLAIYVQGEHDPAFVEKRIDHYLLRFREILRNMNKTEFERRKSVQWESWRVPSNNLESHGYKLWQEIFHGHYNFFRDAKKQFILGNITLSELQVFYDGLIGIKPGSQRRLSVHVNAAEGNPKLVKEEVIPVGPNIKATMEMRTNEENSTTEMYHDEVDTKINLIEETTTVTILPTETDMNTMNDESNPKKVYQKSPLNLPTIDFSTIDFLQDKSVEIQDVVAWKRMQYLFPTPRLF